MKTQKKLVFCFFKEAMTFQTKKAQLIKMGNVNDPVKVWLPLSQISVSTSTEDDTMNVVMLPEWLANKNPYLYEYADINVFDPGVTY